MGNINLVINGVNTNAQSVVKLEQGITQAQVNKRVKSNDLDEIMVYDEQAGEVYLASGKDMNFRGLDKYLAGDRHNINAVLNGKPVLVVPFVDSYAGTMQIFDDENNSPKDQPKARKTP